jgi:hypothetical protein
MLDQRTGLLGGLLVLINRPPKVRASTCCCPSFIPRASVHARGLGAALVWRLGERIPLVIALPEWCVIVMQSSCGLPAFLQGDLQFADAPQVDEFIRGSGAAGSMLRPALSRSVLTRVPASETKAESLRTLLGSRDAAVRARALEFLARAASAGRPAHALISGCVECVPLTRCSVAPNRDPMRDLGFLPLLVPQLKDSSPAVARAALQVVSPLAEAGTQHGA